MNSGHKIPTLGFGTCLVEGGSEFFRKAVMEYGYRHLDTAMKYGNESEVGDALQMCFKEGLKREDVFITTKLDQDDKNDVEGAIKGSLSRLQLDYIDLYLIHWMKPAIDWETNAIKSPPIHIVWQHME